MHRGERGSAVATVALVLICAMVGGLAGYLLAYAGHESPEQRPLAVPLPAQSPSIPTDPPIDVVPDPDRYLPLSTHLDYGHSFINNASTRWRYDVPRGWERFVTENSGIRWTLPGNPDYTYSMRVAPISVPISTAILARERIAAVRGSTGIEHVQELDRDDRSVTFTYVTDDHAKYQHSYWLSEPGSSIGVFEITVSGRLRDQVGLEALLDHLVQTTERVS